MSSSKRMRKVYDIFGVPIKNSYPLTRSHKKEIRYKITNAILFSESIGCEIFKFLSIHEYCKYLCTSVKYFQQLTKNKRCRHTFLSMVSRDFGFGWLRSQVELKKKSITEVRF